MDADAKLDSAIRRQPGVALHQSVLHLDGAPHRIDDAAKFDQNAVARALNHPAVMNRNDRVDQVASERAQPRQDAILVGAGKPREADDVGDQNCRQLSGYDHGVAPRPGQNIGLRPKHSRIGGNAFDALRRRSHGLRANPNGNSLCLQPESSSPISPERRFSSPVARLALGQRWRWPSASRAQGSRSAIMRARRPRSRSNARSRPAAGKRWQSMATSQTRAHATASSPRRRLDLAVSTGLSTMPV